MWRDWTENYQKVGVALGIIGFLLSAYSFGVNRDLTEQQLKIQNDLLLMESELNKLVNFNTTIYGGEKFIYLESIHFQYNKNGTLDSVILRGNLSTTINIITPHYGRSEIIINNFTRYDKLIYVEGMEKHTEIKFVRQPNYLYTYQGLNSFKVDLPLACYIWPHTDLVPLPGESTPPFIIGKINFEIIFHDMQTSMNTSSRFSTEVNGIIRMPVS